MVRMYRYMAERTAMALAFLRANTGAPDKIITNFGQQYRRTVNGDDPLARIFYDHFDVDTPYGTPYKVGDLIQNLTEQIQQMKERDQNETGDLIERMVSILQLPYSRNLLSGRTIGALRQALLLPQELSGTGTALQQRELSCVSCGRKMQHGEMATVTIDHNTMSLQCYQCFQPTHAACRNCEDAAPIDRKFWKRNFDCGCAERKEKEAAARAAAEAAGTPTAAPGQIIIDTVRTTTTTTPGVGPARTVAEWVRDQQAGPLAGIRANNEGPPRRHVWMAAAHVRRNGLMRGDRQLPEGAERFHGAPLDQVTEEEVMRHAVGREPHTRRPNPFLDGTTFIAQPVRTADLANLVDGGTHVAAGVHIQDETGDITGAPAQEAVQEPMAPLFHVDVAGPTAVRNQLEPMLFGADADENVEDDGDDWQDEPGEEEEE
jgi:hypothetical protein